MCRIQQRGGCKTPFAENPWVVNAHIALEAIEGNHGEKAVAIEPLLPTERQSLSLHPLFPRASKPFLAPNIDWTYG